MSVPWYLMAKGKGGGGYKTASGPIVSISDAVAAPLRSLLVAIDPVQEGTGDPSPDNVRPISGWDAANVWRTGKNLLPNKTGVRFPASSIYIGQEDGTTYPIHLFAGKTYSLSYEADGTGQVAYFRPSDGDTAIFTSPYTAPRDMDIQLWIYATGITSVTNFQLELGSTASAYEPYSGNQYTIQLGQTVYGGTLDVTNGVLTVDHASVKFGNWMKSLISNYGTKGGYYYNGANLTPPMASGAFYNDSKTKCTHFTKKANADSGMGIWIGANNTYFYFAHVIENISDIETSAKFCEWLEANDVYMTYPLATPITIPLTPTEISTLAGQNVLWADCGDVTVEYLSAGGANPDLMKLAVAFMGRR